jgi:hypothetical protein
MFVTLDSVTVSFVQCGRKLKLSSNSGDSRGKKLSYKQSYGGTYGAFGESLESGGRFCVGVFGRNLLQSPSICFHV